MWGIPDLGQYCDQFPSVVTLEPETLNLKPISSGKKYYASHDIADVSKLFILDFIPGN